MGQRQRAAPARDALVVGETGRHQSALPRLRRRAGWGLSTLAIVARSASSGSVTSQASQISFATASGVARRLITRILASFHFPSPLAVCASPQRAARMPATLV